MPSARRSPVLALRVLLWRARHLVVLAAVLLAGTSAVRAIAPPPPPTGPVVVAVADVPAGHVLRPGDVRVARVPVALVPQGAMADPEEVVGRGVAVSLTPGLPVVPSLLEGDRFGLDPPQGTVVVAVTLGAAASSALLRPGDVVDVVAATDPVLPAVGTGGDGAVGPPEPTVLASRAVVVDVADDEPADEGMLTTATPAGDAVVTLVAVTPEEGRRLAATAGWAALGAVLVG